jgi:hypothetical protein
MSLATITFLVSGAIGLLGLWALVFPVSWRAAMKAYPRFLPAGWVLVVIDMVWFAFNIKASPLGGLDQYKPWLWLVTPAVIFLLIRYLDELLAVRALGGLLLLVPGVIFDASRIDYATPYRLVMVLVAFGIAVVGCLFVSGPHNFRQWLASPIATNGKARRTGAALLGLALSLAAVSAMHYVARAP